MNRSYLVVPIIGLVAFVSYSIYWKTHVPPAQPAVTRAADPYAERSGRKEAEAEFAAGKLALIEASAPVSWDRERREIAQRKFSIELRRAPEPVTEASAKYVDAFNRFMRPRIIARHGRSVFDAIHQEAIALMESRRSPGTARENTAIAEGVQSPASSTPPSETGKK